MIRFTFLFIYLFSSAILAKSCYTLNHKQMCYKRYFSISSIYKPSLHTKYYKSKDKKIYSFEDNINIRFKRIGAILTIEDDFDIKFVDKDKKETYIYQLNNPDELFSIITNLNETTYISKASPIRHRKLTIAEHKALQEAKEASMERRLDNAQNLDSATQRKLEEYKAKQKAIKEKNGKKISNLKKGAESDLMW